MKIAIVTASPMTVNAFLCDLIVRLSMMHQVTVVTNITKASELMLSTDNVTIQSIGINRKVSLYNDVRAQYALVKLFKESNFDMVYSVTPKAGLLTMIAAFVARVQFRVHIFTGQVWITKVGIKRFILKIMDICIAKLATHLLTDSASQMQFLVKNKIVDKNKINVLANGSISGVDLKRFSPDVATRTAIRLDLNIDDNDIAFLFLGRLDPDKGIEDLVDAFKLLNDQRKNVKLIIVGPDEANMREIIMLKMGNGSNCIKFFNYTSSPEHYMNAADVLCLPSYREGFGSVVIEAAAVGIPAIGSNIYGVRDAIVNNVTGLLFPARNVEALFEAMQVMVSNEKIRKQLGDTAKQRVIDQFSQEFVTASFINYFEEIFNRGRA